MYIGLLDQNMLYYTYIFPYSYSISGSTYLSIVVPYCLLAVGNMPYYI